MKKLLKTFGICSLAVPVMLALSGGNSPQAASVSGQTSLTVNVPAFLVLYYPSNLTINLADISTATADAGGFSYDESTNTLTGTLTTSGADVYDNLKTLTIPNIWAIRGITASGTAKVAITSTDAILNGPASKTIPISDWQVTPSGGTAGQSVTTPLTGMTPKFGSVSMTLDMTSLNGAGAQSGTFNSASYTITVSDT